MNIIDFTYQEVMSDWGHLKQFIKSFILQCNKYKTYLLKSSQSKLIWTQDRIFVEVSWDIPQYWDN